MQHSDDPTKDGVDIKVFKDTGTVELTDRSTGIKRSTDSNGVETTDYSANGGGRTITEIKGNTETITIESVNRQERKLVVEHTETGARVQEYTDGEGNKYKYTGVIDEKDKPIYALNLPPVCFGVVNLKLRRALARREAKLLLSEWRGLFKFIGSCVGLFSAASDFLGLKFKFMPSRMYSVSARSFAATLATWQTKGPSLIVPNEILASSRESATVPVYL